VHIQVPVQVADSIPVARAPLVPTPDTVRGLYVNRWAAIGRRVWEQEYDVLLALA